MALIYKITNKINGKSYIGKTEREDIKHRFREHKKDSKRKRCKDRPLYRAFNKYGEENFEIELVEETDNPEEREIYYIEFFGTYGKTGYNATLGGDGARYITITDEEFIAYFRGDGNQVIKDTAAHFGVDPQTVTRIMQKHNIVVPRVNPTPPRKVKQYTKDKKYLREFSSITDAAKYINNMNLRGHISRVCAGYRKTCGGYIWEWSD